MQNPSSYYDKNRKFIETNIGRKLSEDEFDAWIKYVKEFGDEIDIKDTELNKNDRELMTKFLKESLEKYK